MSYPEDILKPGESCPNCTRGKIVRRKGARICNRYNCSTIYYSSCAFPFAALKDDEKFFFALDYGNDPHLKTGDQFQYTYHCYPRDIRESQPYVPVVLVDDCDETRSEGGQPSPGWERPWS